MRVRVIVTWCPRLQQWRCWDTFLGRMGSSQLLSALRRRWLGRAAKLGPLEPAAHCAPRPPAGPLVLAGLGLLELASVERERPRLGRPAMAEVLAGADGPAVASGMVQLGQFSARPELGEPSTAA